MNYPLSIANSLARQFVSLLACVLLLSPVLAMAQAGDPFASLPRAQVRMVQAPGQFRVKEKSPGEIRLVYQPELEEPKITSFEINGPLILILLLLGGGIFWLYKKKKTTLGLWLFLALLFTPTGAHAVNVTAFLVTPSDGQLVSANPESTFRTLLVRGGAVIDGDEEGLFTLGTPSAVQVLLNYEDPSPLTIPVQTSDFVIEQDNLHFAFPVNIPDQPPFSSSDGASFTFAIEMIVDDEVYRLPLIDASSNLGEIVMDSLPPQLAVDFPNGTAPTNVPVAVEISCTDSGSGCAQNQYDLLVKGNFCADEGTCDTRAIRTVRLCDQVDNCTTREIEVDFYDPIPPMFQMMEAFGQNHDGLRLSRRESERELHIDGRSRESIAADRNYDFKLYFESERGLLTPHMIKNGVPMMPDKWSEDDPTDLSDPTIDIATYAGLGMLCGSGGQDMVWCSAQGDEILANCCLLEVDETLSEAFESHLCSDGSDDFVSVGGFCQPNEGGCVNEFGEKGLWDMSGSCLVGTCPFGYERGMSQRGQDNRRCYLAQNTIWRQTCGECVDGTRSCEVNCELHNNIPLGDDYCDLTIRPNAFQSCS